MQRRPFRSLICLAGVAIIAISASAHAAISPLTPDEITRQIRRDGAHAVAQSLSAGYADGPTSFDRVMDNAAGGDAAWLRVLILLRPGTDAALSESIEQAQSLALQSNPKEVLSEMAAGEIGTPDLLCSPPMIEETQDEVLRYVRRAIDKVSAVRDAGLSAVRRACLNHLQAFRWHQ